MALGRSLGLGKSQLGKDRACACAVCGALSRWKEVSHFWLKLLSVYADAFVLGPEGLVVCWVFEETVREWGVVVVGWVMVG